MPWVDWQVFTEAARSGQQVVSFPTDTVPALACHPDHASLLFDLKQRSLAKPLILMAASASALWPYVKGTLGEQQRWTAVSDRYWPGALTLVLPASDRVPASLNPLSPGSIGMRVPDCAIARTILAATGPLATTSANRSGELALETLEAIATQFPDVLLLSPTALPEFQPNLEQAIHQPIGSGIASTVAQWRNNGWAILRSGAISLSDL
jgi:L-threonylcarbamoyladenylate synthase